MTRPKMHSSRRNLNTKSSIAFNRVSSPDIATAGAHSRVIRSFPHSTVSTLSVQEDSDTSDIMGRSHDFIQAQPAQQPPHMRPCEECRVTHQRVASMENELSQVKERLRYFEQEVWSKLNEFVHTNKPPSRPAGSITSRSVSHRPSCDSDAILDACSALERLISRSQMRS